MNRRDFVRSSGLLSLGGLVAGPQVWEWLERLTWKRTLFPGFGGGSVALTVADWDALLKDAYVNESIVEAVNIATPFAAHLRRWSAPRSLFGRDCIYSVRIGAHV